MRMGRVAALAGAWLADSREVGWMLARHHSLVETDRDRTLHQESGTTVREYRTAVHRRLERADAAGALEPLRHLLAERARAWGWEHPLVLSTRLTAAGLRAEAGDESGAARDFKQLTQESAQLCGEDHPYTLWARRNAAYWSDDEQQQRLRLRAEAAASARGALDRHGYAAERRLRRWQCTEGHNCRDLSEYLSECQTRVLGFDHPYKRRLNRFFDWSYSEMKDLPPRGRWQKPDPGLPTRRRLRKEDPETGAYQGLAQVRRVLTDAAGAAEAAEELLARRAKALGGTHPLVLWTRLYAGCLRGGAGDTAGAVASLDLLLQDLLRLQGEEHPFVLHTRLALAGLLGDTGEGWQPQDRRPGRQGR